MTLFFRQLIGELRKMFARKRTYLGFGAFLLMEVLLLFMFQQRGPKMRIQRMIEGNGYAFDDYFSGLTLALIVLVFTVLLLGSPYLALVAGDVVAKEAEEGTLRMILCRPVSRVRILALKLTACVIYTIALIAFMGTSVLGFGMLYRGAGGLFASFESQGLFALYPFHEGLWRYAISIPALALSLLTVSSLGFMFSCFNMKPAAATVLTLSIVMLDSIFNTIPYFESLKPYFITYHIGTWTNVFQPVIPWPRMVEDYTYLLAMDITFVVIGAFAFQQRDFKA